ncbi:OR22C protein, partial [Pseudoatta argentina]
MQERVTLKKTIAIMKLSLFVIWFWPLPLGTSKCKILCVKLYQCICILMTIGVIASAIYGLVKNKNTNDLDSFMRSLFSLVSLCHVIGNIWCHLIIYQQLQYVTLKMENFCALIKPHEETIVQREYVDKYSNFYGVCISLFYMRLFGLFIEPVMLDQPLPTAAEFPFDASHQPLRAITYAGEVALTVRPFAMVTVLFATVALITFGLVFIAVSIIQCNFIAYYNAKTAYLYISTYCIYTHGAFSSLIVPYNFINNITFEAEYFCNSVKPREEVVIQRYIDKCATFYGVSSIIFYFIVVAACAIAPIVHQPFPMLIEYPFDVYYEPLKTIIYTHQAIVGFIVSGQLCLNTFVATLLWFASARLEIITEDLRTFTNVYQLTKCIKEHQKILEYTAEVIIVARCFALTCICCSTINLIIIGVSFLTNQSLLLRFKYTFMILACLAEVFMFAWPAERLIFLSNDISQAAFDTHWYNQSDEIRKLLQIIMLRSQKVVTIAVSCITPSISFNYLTSVRERETEI